MSGPLEHDSDPTRVEAEGTTDEQAAEIQARQQHDQFMRRKYQQMFDDLLLMADIIEDDLGIDILNGAYPRQKRAEDPDPKPSTQSCLQMKPN